jgi:hypothetical protein
MHTLKHELVHAIMSKYGGPLGAPFNPGIVEGIAVAIATPPSLKPFAALSSAGLLPPAEDYMKTANFVRRKQSTAYWLSAGFVEFLVKKYGMEKYKRLYSSCNFKRTYGKSLRELDEEYRKYLSSISFSGYDLEYGKLRLGVEEKEKRAVSPRKEEEEEKYLRKLRFLFNAGDCGSLLKYSEGGMKFGKPEREREANFYIGACLVLQGEKEKGLALLKRTDAVEKEILLLYASAETPEEAAKKRGRALTYMGELKRRAAVCVAKRAKLTKNTLFALFNPTSEEGFALLSPFSRDCPEIAILIGDKLKGEAKEKFLLSVLSPADPYYNWAVSCVVRDYYYESDFEDAERLMKEHPAAPLTTEFKRRFEFVRRWVRERKDGGTNREGS